MSLKDDIKDVQEDTKKLQEQVNEHSLTWEMLHDYKVENITLKVLLGLSIIASVLIAIVK